MHYESKAVIAGNGQTTCSGAKCTASFGFEIGKGAFNVIATDYISYSVVYICSNILGLSNFFRNELVWILSRDQTMTSSALSSAETAIKNMGYDINNLNIELNRTPLANICELLP